MEGESEESSRETIIRRLFGLSRLFMVTRELEPGEWEDIDTLLDEIEDMALDEDEQ